MLHTKASKKQINLANGSAKKSRFLVDLKSLDDIEESEAKLSYFARYSKFGSTNEEENFWLEENDEEKNKNKLTNLSIIKLFAFFGVNVRKFFSLFLYSKKK